MTYCQIPTSTWTISHLLTEANILNLETINRFQVLHTANSSLKIAPNEGSRKMLTLPDIHGTKLTYG